MFSSVFVFAFARALKKKQCPKIICSEQVESCPGVDKASVAAALQAVRKNASAAPHSEVTLGST